MQRTPDVLVLLDELLTNELTAINQYLLHATTCGNWGYLELAEKFHEESKGEAEHAKWLAERILFLEGTPNMQRMHTVHGGASVREMLEADLRMEYDAIAALERGIEMTRNVGDNATSDLLTKILVSEQEDTHWIEAQLGLMRQIGEQNYLAQRLRG